MASQTFLEARSFMRSSCHCLFPDQVLMLNGQVKNVEIDQKELTK